MKNSWKTRLAALLLAMLLPISAVADRPRNIQIVTSFYPLYIFTLNLCDGIDSVTVTNMADQPAGCLHDYQIQTSDMRRLAGADVFIICGAGMETFLDMVCGALPGLEVITASQGIELICDEDDHHHDEHDEDHDHE